MPECIGTNRLPWMTRGLDAPFQGRGNGLIRQGRCSSCSGWFSLQANGRMATHEPAPPEPTLEDWIAYVDALENILRGRGIEVSRPTRKRLTELAQRVGRTGGLVKAR